MDLVVDWVAAGRGVEWAPAVGRDLVAEPAADRAGPQLLDRAPAVVGLPQA